MKQLAVLLLPSGWDACPSQDTQHEATSSITSPPRWNASPSQDAQHRVTMSITTPPEWDASPSQDAQHEATSSITTPPRWNVSEGCPILRQIYAWHCIVFTSHNNTVQKHNNKE